MDNQKIIFSFRLSEEDMIAKSIRVWCKISQKDTQHFIKIFSKGRIKDKDRVHIFKELTNGDNYIVYDDLEILVRQEEFIPPVASSDFRPSLFSNFSIIVFAENNTHIPTENYMTFWKRLNGSSKILCWKIFLEKIKEKNKTTIYIWGMNIGKHWKSEE